MVCSNELTLSGFIRGKLPNLVEQCEQSQEQFVARGLGRRAGIDVFETFSPCPPVASVFLPAAIACELGLELCFFDAE